jgi:hypothetical protein
MGDRELGQQTSVFAATLAPMQNHVSSARITFFQSLQISGCCFHERMGAFLA